MSELGNVSVSVNKVREALDYAIGNSKVSQTEADEVFAALATAKGAAITLDATKVPVGLLKVLLDSKALTANQRRIFFLAVAGTSGDAESVLRTVVNDAKGFYAALLVITKTGNEGGPNMETRIGDRWYPTNLYSEYNDGGWGGPYVSMVAQSQICDILWAERAYVDDNDFKSDDESRSVGRTVLELLEKNNLRPLKTNMQEFMKKCRASERLNEKPGKMLSVMGPAVFVYQLGWYNQINYEAFGSFTHPRKVISESEIEKRDNSYGRGRSERQAPMLPFVRVFSLDQKKYVYVDVDDIEEYAFDTRAMDRLVLPPSIDSLLRRIFAADTTKLFGDVVQGKHGGMVMLAAGDSGVGKTLTAEVFSEVTKRPLYVLELGELGTDLKSVEQNLQKIFVRASRWNAILLFDEADIFLAKRDADLERSAIVGVFLRLLDYYPGMLFLTTNRPDIIDPAFQSRISLQLNYPSLDETRRKKIWQIMLDTAKVKLPDIDGIPALALNGRNIRNIVRMLTLLYPRGEDGFSHVTTEQIKEVCNFRPGAGA